MEKILPTCLSSATVLQECAEECRDRCDPQKDHDVLLVFYYALVFSVGLVLDECE